MSSRHQALQMLALKINKYEYIYPREVVGRGSETLLQVGKKINWETYQVMGYLERFTSVFAHDFSNTDVNYQN